jgi:predicted CopG family antitoxin
MATKTISIDVEAYKRLKSVQKPNESFSQTIKRAIRPAFDLQQWLKKVRSSRLSDETLAAVEGQIAHRRRKNRRER